MGYEFKRGKRRTIGLSVSAEGLTVSAPRWTPVAEVEALLHEKPTWVIGTTAAVARARQRAGAVAHRVGRWCRARFLGSARAPGAGPDPRLRASRRGAGARPTLTQADGVAVLRLGLAHNAGEAQIRDAAQGLAHAPGQALFAERLDHFAPQLGVSYSKLRLSSAGTRWGSASADGTIRLNWRLIHLKLEMVDYVVVHELSHLHHMDHSPQFWDVVASVMPDHKQRRQALRQSAVPLTE